MQNNQLAPSSNPPTQLISFDPKVLEILILIAEAIHANASATVLLARATAGEFEPGEEPQGEQYLDGTRQG